GHGVSMWTSAGTIRPWRAKAPLTLNLRSRTTKQAHGWRSAWLMCNQEGPINPIRLISPIAGVVMDISQFTRHSETEWIIEAIGRMRVPAVIYATEELVRDMDQKVFEQTTNVAMLPGIVKASYAMPDAHWGYGFPIGGVAAFDPDEGGVVS